MNLIPISSLMELKIVQPKDPAAPAAPKRNVRTKAKAKSPKKATPAEAEKKQQSREKAAKTREKNAREAQKRAAEQNKAEREARRAKVKEILAAKASDEKPGLGRIPAQIAHCMMALHVKRRKSRVAAWNICRWAMTKHGYLAGPYRVNTKLPKAVKQTAKGSKRSFQHGAEKAPLGGGVPGDAAGKFGKFVRMFKTVEPEFLPKNA